LQINQDWRWQRALVAGTPKTEIGQQRTLNYMGIFLKHQWRCTLEQEEFEAIINAGIKENKITWEISNSQRALVLSVPIDSDFVPLLDKIASSGQASLVPLSPYRKVEPIPCFHIDKYTVSPMPRQKRMKNGMYNYDYIYTPK
jgi:hypothetical protein